MVKTLDDDEIEACIYDRVQYNKKLFAKTESYQI